MSVKAYQGVTLHQFCEVMQDSPDWLHLYILSSFCFFSQDGTSNVIDE